MTAAITRLLDIMTRLRDPKSGCPWDVEQTFATIAPYTIEEAYEVAEAIAEDDMEALRAELGDLLLQVVFHSQMAREAGHFDFDGVADAVSDKMVRRHPHVFADAKVASVAAQTHAWEDHKELERRAASGESHGGSPPGALEGVPAALPALLRADKLGKRAARVGFDWPDSPPVLAKIHEEIDELEAEMAIGASDARLEHEIGDLLLACANLARHLKINPETALREANRRFERRFGRVEALAVENGNAVANTPLDKLEAFWEQAKLADDGRSDRA